MKFGVVVFPGSNCEADCHYAVGEVLGEEVDYVWHKEKDVSSYDCLILPGGFSYGDYLRCGAIARFSPVMESITNYAREGGLVIGLLPGAMLQNMSLRFICKYVNLRLENVTTPWTNRGKQGQVLRIPIAHNEGNYIADGDLHRRLLDEGRIILRYCDEKGEVTQDANPNGSMDNIAGVCNEGFNVFGLMPHPERASEEVLGSSDGLVIWESIMAHYRGKG
jgi:phosphoribosylformylglycinamidine synthase I